MTNPAAFYRETKARVSVLAGSLTPEQLALPVPACPVWTVHELLAHLAGGAADMATGNLAGAPGDEWSEAHIGPRRNKPVAELLAEWDEVEPQLLANLDGKPVLNIAALDCITHEHDLRGPVGQPGDREGDAVLWATQQMVAGLDARLRQAGAPALRIRAGDDEWLVGEGDPAATLTTTHFELFRALIGRRSAAQISGYEWDGDPAPYLDAFAVFAKPTVDIVE